MVKGPSSLSSQGCTQTRMQERAAVLLPRDEPLLSAPAVAAAPQASTTGKRTEAGLPVGCVRGVAREETPLGPEGSASCLRPCVNGLKREVPPPAGHGWEWRHNKMGAGKEKPAGAAGGHLLVAFSLTPVATPFLLKHRESKTNNNALCNHKCEGSS